MSLSYWVEAMLSLSAPAGTKTPGSLVYQVAADYNFPLVPPGIFTSFIIGPRAVAAARGLPVYMLIEYKMEFGYMVPGAFRLTVVAGGINSYNGTLGGYQLEHGFDMLFFNPPDVQVVYYVTNLSNMNQYYQHINHYLIVTSEKDYKELRYQLEKMQFPYELPPAVEVP